MIRIVMERNYDAQIEDAFRWALNFQIFSSQLSTFNSQLSTFNFQILLWAAKWYLSSNRRKEPFAKVFWQKGNRYNPKVRRSDAVWGKIRCFRLFGSWHFLGQNLGESLKDEEIEGLLDEGDLEGDGSISYMDFCAIKNLMWKIVLYNNNNSLGTSSE